MTGRAIIVLAVVATGLLMLGAQLLNGEGALMVVCAITALAAGTALAATAVAGAWRTPAAPRDVREPQPSRPGSFAGPT